MTKFIPSHSRIMKFFNLQRWNVAQCPRSKWRIEKNMKGFRTFQQTSDSWLLPPPYSNMSSYMQTVEQRLLEKCILVDECLIWQHAQVKGYGRLKMPRPVWSGYLPNKAHSAHRVAYLIQNQHLLNEKMKEDNVVSHLCHNSLCCNHEHLSLEPADINSDFLQ